MAQRCRRVGAGLAGAGPQPGLEQRLAAGETAVALLQALGREPAQLGQERGELGVVGRPDGPSERGAAAQKLRPAQHRGRAAVAQGQAQPEPGGLGLGDPGADPQLGRAERQPVLVSRPNRGVEGAQRAAPVASREPVQADGVPGPDAEARRLAGARPGRRDERPGRVAPAELERQAGPGDPGVERQLRPAFGVQRSGQWPDRRSRRPAGGRSRASPAAAAAPPRAPSPGVPGP